MRGLVLLLVAGACADDPTPCFDHSVGIPHGIVGHVGTTYNETCGCYPSRQYARVDATDVISGEVFMTVADADGYYELVLEPGTYRLCGEGYCRHIDVGSGVARWDYAPIVIDGYPFEPWREIQCTNE